jgi:hypothetical protein
VPGPNTAKLLAKIINAYRSAYVTSVEGLAKGLSLRQLLMRAILGTRTVAPKSGYMAGAKSTEEFLKMIQSGFRK